VAGTMAEAGAVRVAAVSAGAGTSTAPASQWRSAW
jgi:hypothetical protein